MGHRNSRYVFTLFQLCSAMPSTTGHVGRDPLYPHFYLKEKSSFYFLYSLFFLPHIMSVTQSLKILENLYLILCVQSCPAVCGPMDYSPPGFSAHGIFQARILRRGAIFYSRGSSQPRDRTLVSCVYCFGRLIFTTSTTGKH